MGEKNKKFRRVGKLMIARRRKRRNLSAKLKSSEATIAQPAKLFRVCPISKSKRLYGLLIMCINLALSFYRVERVTALDFVCTIDRLGLTANLCGLTAAMCIFPFTHFYILHWLSSRADQLTTISLG